MPDVTLKRREPGEYDVLIGGQRAGQAFKSPGSPVWEVVGFDGTPWWDTRAAFLAAIREGRIRSRMLKVSRG